ncbi:MAG: hypothetical protein KAV82_08795 [Phycisphaerae bacterium]|nr:hypothetical protein [Phycisphaerae bacterium]
MLLFCCALVGGCTGWAKLHLVPTKQMRIIKTTPLMTELHAAECYYWIEDNRITIALADENISLAGELGKKTLVGSIVLEGLPAHQAREYRLDHNSIRGRFRRGARHVRFASLGGVCSIWLEGGRRIRGRLHALAKQQQFHILRGWVGNRQAYLLGDFVAVQNRERGEELLRRSEADGMGRGVPPPAYGRPRAITGPPVHPDRNQ